MAFVFFFEDRFAGDYVRVVSLRAVDPIDHDDPGEGAPARLEVLDAWLLDEQGVVQRP